MIIRQYPRRTKPNAAALSLPRWTTLVAVGTVCSLMSICIAWFHVPDMQTASTHSILDLSQPGNTATTTATTPQQQQQPLGAVFTASSACRAAKGACHIHYPVTIGTIHNNNNNAVGVLERPSANALAIPKDSYMATQKGFKAGPNQDRSFLLKPWAGIPQDPNALLIGLFDGHGTNGHLIAQTATSDFPVQLLANLEHHQQQQQHGNISVESSAFATEKLATSTFQQVLHQTFLQVDHEPRMQQIPVGGSTALAVWKIGTVVHLASAGDSTAFVAVYNRNTNTTGIVETARRHKPADPQERARIQAAGGRVYIPINPKVTSRVLIGPMALAMSRCFGDYEGKQTGILIAQPTIKTVDLRELNDGTNEFFVVVASDGVVDFMPNLHVAEKVAAALYGLESTTGLLADTCHALIRTASEQWDRALNGTYRDDMTIVVSKLTL